MAVTPEERIIELKQTVKELRDRIEAQNDEQMELLRFFELAVVETTADMRIINSYGADDLIFEDAKKLLERGENLIKVVYKSTKSTKERTESNEEEQQQKDLEAQLMDYVEGPREERVFDIVGEKEDGEIFMLIWRIRRVNKIFKSYFKMIPSNKIVENVVDQHERELEEYKRNLKVIFESISDGVTILDTHNEIIYMNDAGKRSFLSNQNKLLREASLEGKLFQDIFMSEDQEVMKKRVDYNQKVIATEKPISYEAMVNDMSIQYSVRPLFGDEGRLMGIFIISTFPKTLINPKPKSNPKIMQVFRKLNNQKNYLLRQNEELNDKLDHMSGKAKDLDSILRLYFINMQYLPVAMSIQNAESGKFEYINSAFEDFFGKLKTEVIDYTDKKVLGSEMAEKLSDATEQLSGHMEEIETPEALVKQVYLVEPAGQPPRVIRVYEKKSQ
jgi:PAS domain-containing protein